MRRDREVWVDLRVVTGSRQICATNNTYPTASGDRPGQRLTVSQISVNLVSAVAMVVRRFTKKPLKLIRLLFIVQPLPSSHKSKIA